MRRRMKFFAYLGLWQNDKDDGIRLNVELYEALFPGQIFLLWTQQKPLTVSCQNRMTYKGAPESTSKARLHAFNVSNRMKTSFNLSGFVLVLGVYNSFWGVSWPPWAVNRDISVSSQSHVRVNSTLSWQQIAVLLKLRISDYFLFQYMSGFPNFSIVLASIFSFRVPTRRKTESFTLDRRLHVKRRIQRSELIRLSQRISSQLDSRYNCYHRVFQSSLSLPPCPSLPTIVCLLLFNETLSDL